VILSFVALFLCCSAKSGRKLIVRHAGIAAGWPRVRRQAAIRQVTGD
jgi:hypothetical protein